MSRKQHGVLGHWRLYVAMERANLIQCIVERHCVIHEIDMTREWDFQIMGR